VKIALDQVRAGALVTNRAGRNVLRSIAVLPFVNLSADKESEYFSDGLAEEIIDGLGKIPGLRVVARTSSFAFRGRSNAIREIGRELNAGGLVEGSVRRTGDCVRVTIRLIDAIDESRLWSERFHRELTSTFVVQDEIAEAVVAGLNAVLTASASDINSQ
jgi:TolB-like protein